VFATWWHRIVIDLKRAFYRGRGEPYRIEGNTLRYAPGTRPVRLRYSCLPNGISRYDALQVASLSNHLKEGDTAVDVGAHRSTYSVLMAAKCGQTGRVVAIEPDPYSREVLVKNFSFNPSIKRPTVEMCACSDGIGEAILFTRGGNSQSSLVPSGSSFPSRTNPKRFECPLSLSIRICWNTGSHPVA
jgi:FkbM family methyltransferase